MRPALFGCALIASACTHDLSAMFGPEAKTREADTLLASGDIEAARAAYEAVLADHPQSPNALFGAAFTDLAPRFVSRLLRAQRDVAANDASWRPGASAF